MINGIKLDEVGSTGEDPSQKAIEDAVHWEGARDLPHQLAFVMARFADGFQNSGQSLGVRFTFEDLLEASLPQVLDLISKNEIAVVELDEETTKGFLVKAKWIYGCNAPLALPHIMQNVECSLRLIGATETLDYSELVLRLASVRIFHAMVRAGIAAP